MRLPARMHKKIWDIKPADERAGELARQVRVSPLTAQILINREVTDKQEMFSFLNPKLTGLIEPEKMGGITQAVERIFKAIANNEQITIYGDYDVDGMTSIAILNEAITLLGGKVDFYVPHRVDEGYGLNKEAIDSIAKAGTNLIITVDCGINDVELTSYCKSLGMDIIITDHHCIGEALPDASAVVHPMIDPDYGNADAAGAMVAFKLAWALSNKAKAGEELRAKLRQFLINATTLAAIGTVADVVDLRGENRIVTNFGLKAIGDSQLTGLHALIDIAGLKGQAIDSYHIGFRVAPMLNAAGRMGHARLAVELLTSDNEIRSYRIAEYLKSQNTQRQQHEKKISKQVMEMIKAAKLDHPDRKSIVLADESWHRGVIGIVASRVIDRYYRPTILFNMSNGVSSGSGRSIKGFNLLEGIKACSEHLLSFGGHAMAAGISLETSRLGDFTAAFEKYAQENISEEESIAKLEIDAAATISNISVGFVNELDMLGPFGKGNPKPLLATMGVERISSPRRVGANQKHLQIAVGDGTGSLRCIGFNMGHLEKKLLEADRFDIAYEPAINNFNGASSVQLVLKDIQFDEDE